MLVLHILQESFLNPFPLLLRMYFTMCFISWPQLYNFHNIVPVLN
jgi:hypothetical protein